MEIFNTILFVSSLTITKQILFVKYKQSLLITLKKTFQLWIRSSISLMAVLNNIRIAKTLLICVTISKISIWMLNGYSLQPVMASHHATVSGGFVKCFFAKCSLQRPLHDQILSYQSMLDLRPLYDQILSYQSMLDLCIREIPSITSFDVSQEEMVNVRAELEDGFAKSKTVPGTRSSHHFVPISCNKIAHKLTSEGSEFLQFDFNKSLTEEIDIKKIKCFSYVSCIYDTFWWVGIVTEVNVHEGDLKIEFLHPHGSRKTFSWPSVACKCFVPTSNILCVITAPTATTGQMYQISDTDFEQTLKAYENHKM